MSERVCMYCLLKKNPICVCLRYMMLGGAVDRWMLHVGRFLTGIAGGMTAASIPVGYHGYRNNFKKQFYPLFLSYKKTFLPLGFIT